MDVFTLNTKLDAIDARLTRIETELKITPPITATKPPVSTPSPAAAPVQSTTESGNLLGIIAIICFVLAGGFIIKLSIDSGWLTPTRQIALAALFGFSLIGVGLKFLNMDREYISQLPAAGVIILYLTAFAAHVYYPLISFNAALLISCAISLVCIGLYLRIRNDIYPLIATVGTYLAPVILGFDVETNFSLHYFVLCSVTFAALSIFLKSRTLTMVSAYLALGVTASVGLGLNQNQLIAQVLALHFIIFSIATFMYSYINNAPLTEKEARSFFPILILFYGSEYYFLSLIQPNLAPWLSLAFATFLIILYLVTKRIFKRENLPSEYMIFTFAAIVFFHSGYLELLPEAAGPWLFVLILTGAALLPVRYQTSASTLPMPIMALICIIVWLEYYKMACNILYFEPVSWPAIFFSIASIWLLFIYQNNYIKQKDAGYVLLAGAHILVVSALYRLADPIGSLAVSAFWLAYATGVIFFAFTLKDKVMANSALLVLFFAAGKALLYDAASAPTTVRIFCLLLTGVVFYGAGYLFRKIAEWK